MANKQISIGAGSAPIRVIDNDDGTFSLVVSGKTTRVTATMTRPANTTQYAAGDQVSDSTSAPTAITFADVATVNGGSGLIVDAVCIDSAYVAAALPNLRLYLFSGSPTPNNDNAAWAASDANALVLIGKIEFSAWEVSNAGAGAAGNCASFQRSINLPFKCGSTVNDIYGLLVERGTYTPVSGESWTINLGILQD